LKTRNGMGVLAEAYHNELAPRTLKYFGALGAILGAVSAIDPDALTGWDWWTWVAVAVAVSLLTLLLSIPRSSQVYVHDQGGWSIELVRGDLLDPAEQEVIVTGDLNVTTSLQDVGPTSLIGQVINQWYGGDNAALTAEVSDGLARMGRSGAPVDVGTLIAFGTSVNRSAYLFCLAERTPTGPRTDWRDLSLGYARLWESLRDKQLATVTCPIIGAGFAGTSLSARGTLIFLLLGFHGVSLERRVTRRLRVVISESDFDPRMFRAARTMLGELGYRH